MAKADLTPEIVKSYLHYSPETGLFTWLKTVNNNKAIAGSSAGHEDERGYVRISILRTSCWAHRLAWFYVHGVWPANEIDHIDGNPANNRMSNLRDVGRFGNNQNRTSASKNNISGLIGAHKARGKWIARIMSDGITRHIGTFKTAEEAHLAYVAEKRKMHSTCSI